MNVPDLISLVLNLYVGLGLTLGFGACKESAPGSLIVGVQSMISFIVTNTR
jgi:hypothetical protein